jgi:hypothetical protein
MKTSDVVVPTMFDLASSLEMAGAVIQPEALRVLDLDQLDQVGGAISAEF